MLEEESGLFINAQFKIEMDDDDVEFHLLSGGSGGGPTEITDHNVIKKISEVACSQETVDLLRRINTTKMKDLDFESVFRKMIMVIEDSQLIFNEGNIAR